MASASSPRRCSPRPPSRSAARCASSGTSTSPISPAVQVTSVTPRPSATYRAIVAPWPIDSSSGCAWTRRRRWAGTGTGVGTGGWSGMAALLGALGATRLRRQVEGRGRGGTRDGGGMFRVQPAVELLGEQLRGDLGRVAEHRPRVVLVVVLAGEALAPDLRVVPV